MRPVAASLTVLLLGWALSPASAITIRVPADQPTIQAGLQAAGVGDTVLVACGTYREHNLVLGCGTCLRSETGDPACMTIDAESLGRVLTSTAGAATTRLEGITFTAGYAPFEDESGYGGALLLGDSPMVIRSCAFLGNRAYDSGGAICSGLSSLRVEDCVFDGNAAWDGAGIYMSGTSAQIVHCTFVNNESLIWGGAIFAQLSSPTTITSCTFYGNSATQGSGLWYVYDCDLVVENSLIAFGRGEGIYAWPSSGHPSTMEVRCCDVFGNERGNYGGELEDQTGQNGTISADPLLCDPGAGDFRLATLSPCLPEHNSCGVLMGAYGTGCIAAEVALPQRETSPRGLLLRGNQPNPFRSSTAIAFSLGAPGLVTLSIFDSSGRLVREVHPATTYPAGEHQVSWDGCDATGRPLPSGLYRYRIGSGSEHRTAGMLLLR